MPDSLGVATRAGHEHGFSSMEIYLDLLPLITKHVLSGFCAEHLQRLRCINKASLASVNSIVLSVWQTQCHPSVGAFRNMSRTGMFSVLNREAVQENAANWVLLFCVCMKRQRRKESPRISMFDEVGLNNFYMATVYTIGKYSKRNTAFSTVSNTLKNENWKIQIKDKLDFIQLCRERKAACKLLKVEQIVSAFYSRDRTCKIILEKMLCLNALEDHVCDISTLRQRVSVLVQQAIYDCLDESIRSIFITNRLYHPL